MVSLRWRAVFFAVSLAFLGVPCGVAQDFTLQEVMSAPFNSGLVGSPSGCRFAWIANEQGKRNVWVAEPGARGAYNSHAVTHYGVDDGMEISGLAWTPDGEALVYVRGGDAEFEERPAPNPALLPGVVEQTIWKAPVREGAPVAIGAGHSPVVSPDGTMLAYVWKDQVWTVKLREAGAKPEQLFHGRGTSVRWCGRRTADGSRLRAAGATTALWASTVLPARN